MFEYSEDNCCPKKCKTISVCYECGFNCKWLCGEFVGCEEEPTCGLKALKIKSQCGEIIFVRVDKIVTWSFNEGNCCC